MPIESITGKPGNAKTAFLVKRLMAEDAKHREGKADARPLWVAGVDGLKVHEFHAVQRFHDPREWNAVKAGCRCTCADTDDDSPCEAHVIPNGALIFMDEAWKWFGHLQDASRSPTPPHVLALAEHRHRGIDFVWTYQQPSQIYPFARGMMAEHRHLVRKYGTMFCDEFHWQELCEDVKSTTKREAAQRRTVSIPKETFGLYKSAEVHTIKRRIPFKVLALPVVLLAAAGLLWFAVNALRPANVAANVAGHSLTAPGDLPGQGSSSAPTPVKPVTAYEYAQRLLPRFATMPESAPAYDERPVVSAPDVYCMSSGAGYDAQGRWSEGSVTCLTEQGTRYRLPDAVAREVARDGRPYNAYKPEQVAPAMQPVEYSDAGGLLLARDVQQPAPPSVVEVSPVGDPPGASGSL